MIYAVHTAEPTTTNMMAVSSVAVAATGVRLLLEQMGMI